jgi:hypothetical protein
VDSDVIRKIKEFFVGKNNSGGLFSPLEQLVLFGEVSNEIVDVKKPETAHKPSE